MIHTPVVASPARRSPVLVVIGLFALAVACWVWFGVGDRIHSDLVEVPCEIERFEIHDNSQAEHPFHAELLFRYRWKGRDYASSSLWEGGSESDHYEDIATIRSRFLPGASSGSSATCWVKPSQPGLAFLVKKERIVEVGGVLLGVASTVYGVMAIAGGLKRIVQGPFTRAVHGLFFVLFASMPLIVYCGALLGGFPGSKPLRTASWVAEPAEMIWSRFEARTRCSGARVLIYYKYRFNNEEYRSSRYAADPLAIIEKDAQDFLAAHPGGSSLQVLVDPANPQRAVVASVPPSGSQLFVYWFMFPFLCLGLGGMAYCLMPPPPVAQIDQDGPALPEGQWQRLGARIPWLVPMALTVIALWGAGFVLGGFQLGFLSSPLLLEKILPSLFFGGAAFLFYACGRGAIHAWRAFAGPRWEVSMSSAVLSPGDSVMVRWRMIPGKWTPRRLFVILSAQHEVRHRRPKGGIRFSYPEFARVEVADISDPEGMASGEVEVRMPGDLFDGLPKSAPPVRGQLKIGYYGSSKKIFEEAALFRLRSTV